MHLFIDRKSLFILLYLIIPAKGGGVPPRGGGAPLHGCLHPSPPLSSGTIITISLKDVSLFKSFL